MDELEESLPLPPNLKKPARDATIIQARAAGKTVPESAEAAGAPLRTAERTVAEHRDWIEEQKRRHAVMVLKRLEPATAARLDDAENPESRTGAQSYRVVLESLGWIGKQGDLIMGDKNVSVEIDARSVTFHGVETSDLARAANGS